MSLHIHHHENSTSTNGGYKVQGYKSFKPLRLVTRKKVLIVAFVRTPGQAQAQAQSQVLVKPKPKPCCACEGRDGADAEDSIKLLMVKDSKTGEWHCPGGGARMFETPLQAAERELAEETSGLFSRIRDPVEQFNFITYYRPPELLKIDQSRNELVRSLYTVFVYEIKNFHISLSNFVPNKEVSAIRIASYSEFKEHELWAFFKDFYEQVLKQKLKTLKK